MIKSQVTNTKVFLVGGLVLTLVVCTYFFKNAKENSLVLSTSSDQTGWTTHQDNRFGISFSHPEDSLTREEVVRFDPASNRFFRVQNYDLATLDTPTDAFWMDFSAFPTDDLESTCAFAVKDYLIGETNGLKTYKGTTSDGQNIICFAQTDYDVFVVGQDHSGQNLFKEIADTVKLFEPSWTTHEEDSLKLSFRYPSKDFVEVGTDEEGSFFRLQNFAFGEAEVMPKNSYWMEFFMYPAQGDGPNSTCPRNIGNFEGNLEIMYRGTTKPNENGEGGGLKAACLSRHGYDLYIEGEDNTEERIFDKVLDSVRFFENRRQE